MLGFFLLRHIADKAHALHHATIAVAQRNPGQPDGAALLPCTPLQPQIAFPEAARFPARLRLRMQIAHLARIRLKQGAGKLAQHMLVQQQLSPCGIDLHNPALIVGNENAIQAGLKHTGGQTLFAGCQRFRSDIAVGVDTANRHATAELRHRAALDHAPFSELQHFGSFWR